MSGFNNRGQFPPPPVTGNHKILELRGNKLIVLNCLILECFFFIDWFLDKEMAECFVDKAGFCPSSKCDRGQHFLSVCFRNIWSTRPGLMLHDFILQ